jgi:hypothetical protein
VASTCRYGSIAEEIWGDWNLLWEDSEADYQGHASFLVKKGNKYVFYEWHYGSCSGCDGWEAADATNEEIAAEMQERAAVFNSKKELKGWLEMLEGRNPEVKDPRSQASMDEGGGLAFAIDWMSGGLRSRINAIRAEVGMKPLPEE